MSKYQGRVFTIVSIALWGCLVTGIAHAGQITRVGGGGNVSLSIFQQTGANTFQDITDTYLPTWAPNTGLQTVYIVVNGSAEAPALVDVPTNNTEPNPFLASLTTSRFPGNCTNWGTETGTAALDFTLGSAVPITVGGVAKIGYALTSNDCGGMAVITVGASPDKFVVPKDADAAGNPTGIPDALDVFGVALTPGGDPDGDGLSTFDETVRGFIVGGQHIRLNPTAKDVFLFLVRGQCGPTLLKSGTGGFPTTNPNAGGLDSNLSSLLPPPTIRPQGIAATQTHFLGNSLAPGSTAIRTDEWVDRFMSFTLGGDNATETWTYCNGPFGAGGTCAASDTRVVTAGTTTPAAPTDDRVVTRNQVYPTASGQPMKGLRVTECATTIGTSPHGTGRYGLGAAQGKDEAVVYTDRIRRFVNSTGNKNADVYYSTFQGTSWLPLVKQNTGSITPQQARDFITSKVIQYIMAMEIGHTLKLIAEDLLTTVPTFPHYAAGFGDSMDEALQAITSGTPSGVKFYVPSSFRGASQGSFELTAPPAPQVN